MDTKSCCAELYASNCARLLLGDAMHPGGLALTERLGVMLGLESDSKVLDLASGAGTSAMHIARTFGCKVTGVDYSADNVALSMPALDTAARHILVSARSLPKRHMVVARMCRHEAHAFAFVDAELRGLAWHRSSAGD